MKKDINYYVTIVAIMLGYFLSKFLDSVYSLLVSEQSDLFWASSSFVAIVLLSGALAWLILKGD